MPELSVVGWALIALAAVVVGVSKTGVPGIGILAVVLAATALPEGQKGASVGLLLPMLIIGDVIAVIWYRRHANWRLLFRLMPPAAVGIVAAWGLAHLLGQQRPHLLGPIIGGIVLAMLALNRWWQWRVDRLVRGGRDAADLVPHHWSFAVGVGAAAGVATMLSNAAGPLMVLYLLALRFDKHAFIGTAAWYFFLLNSFKVPFMLDLHWITFGSLKVDLLMAPVVAAGAAGGIVLFKKIPQQAFRVAVELLAAVGAAKLLWDGLIH
ncbi:MAG: hypothetical protein BIFFINMI_01782 [Phycisphaerae bacterium]|nr:hypothetical protein [Phycisphaerae bacterium]